MAVTVPRTCTSSLSLGLVTVSDTDSEAAGTASHWQARDRAPSQCQYYSVVTVLLSAMLGSGDIRHYYESDWHGPSHGVGVTSPSHDSESAGGSASARQRHES